MKNHSPLTNLRMTKKTKNAFFKPVHLFLVSLIVTVKLIREVLNFYYDWQDWYYLFDLIILLLTISIIYTLFRNVYAYSNKLYESESFLQVILESMKQIVIVCDTKGNITYTNEASSRETEPYPVAFEQWRQNWKLYRADGTLADKHDSPLEQALNGEEVADREYMVKWKDQPTGHYLVSGKRLYDKSGELIGAIMVMNDISERKLAESAMKRIANYDALTGLPNRELFHHDLMEKTNAASLENQTYSILFLDLDGFKMVNDTLGHDIGDDLLKQAARRLSDCLRPGDIAARQGGDEFMIYLEGATVEETNEIAETILRSMTFPFMLDGQEIVITASIGISMFPRNGLSPQILIKHANAAMSRAKAYGKNMLLHYTSEMEGISENRLAMAIRLRKALEQQELELYYQPKFNLRNGRIVGLEALLRWNNPELGLVSPGEFIPLAEESGLIVPIGEWVLRHAAEQNKRWQEAGLPSITISVNLSPRQFLQQDLVQRVALMIEESGLQPSYLILEITESMAMHHLEESIRKLDSLKSLGIGLSLDDFGTGFSSLTYLKEFPINELKIDRSFIRDMGVHSSSESIVKAIIAIAQSLHLTVVAEGVETEQQLEFLREQHCDEVQGYYYSPPVPKQEIEILLRTMEITHP